MSKTEIDILSDTIKTQSKERQCDNIFISAFNVKSFGSLRILYDLVDDLDKLKVFDKITVNCSKSIGTQNFPKDVCLLQSGIWDNNFLSKIIWQYLGLWVYSSRNKYKYLLSVNNLTPNFRCEFSILYLHNALPFSRYVQPSYGKWLRVIFQQIYFKILLPIGLKRNDTVIVQQSSLKNQFLSRFRYMENKVVIVPPKTAQIKLNKSVPNKHSNYIYLPVNELCYKNADTLILAFSKLDAEYSNLDLIVTLSEESKLVRRLKKRKKLEMRNIKFVGPQSWEDNVAFLQNAEALFWGSSVESWGLPLSEAVSLNLDIIAPRLPYVEETLGLYDKIYLFDEINQRSVIDALQAWKLKKKSEPGLQQQFETMQLSDILKKLNGIG